MNLPEIETKTNYVVSGRSFPSPEEARLAQFAEAIEYHAMALGIGRGGAWDIDMIVGALLEGSDDIVAIAHAILERDKIAEAQRKSK